MLDTTSQEPRILCHQDLHCIAAVGVNATQDLAEMLLFNRPLGIDGIVSVLSRIVELFPLRIHVHLHIIWLKTAANSLRWHRQMVRLQTESLNPNP